MLYPFSWTTEHGHKATVKNPAPHQYDFTGTSSSGEVFSFTFYGGNPPFKATDLEMVDLENEVYIEWCQLSQTT